MINDNLEDKTEKDNNLNESVNLDESSSTDLDEKSWTDDDSSVEVEDSKENSVIMGTQTINYLDPSIINIKTYEPNELDGMDESTILEENSLYDLGLDKKEKAVVKGNIVRITDRDVFIDIGFKSEGIISKSEFQTVPPIVGEEVDVFIITFEDRKGNLILSREKAEFMLKWNELKEKFENSEIIEGKIIRRIKGGMIVDLSPVQGFLPGSQIDIKPITNFDEYIGQTSDFKIVKFNEMRQNIVLSRKEILATDLDDKRKEVMEKLSVGDVLDGVVKNITDFGAFIDLGGIDGLLHITDITWGRINHPSEKLSLGENLQVKIIDYDPKTVRVSLGLKQLNSEPWDDIDKKYPVDSIVKGKIVNMMKYGAFVELEEGIDGLIHVSDLSWTKIVRHPKEILEKNQDLEVRILEVSRENRRISLGLKQIEDDPWPELSKTFESGKEIEGEIVRILDKGIILSLQNDVEGIVPFGRQVKKNKKSVISKYKIGEKINAVVMEIKPEDKKVILFVEELGGEKSTSKNDVQEFLDNQIEPVGEKIKIPNKKPDKDSEIIED